MYTGGLCRYGQCCFLWRIFSEKIKIREEFDGLIRKQGEEPRFNLNEDDYYLEDFTEPLEDDDDF